ncbi:MAG: multiheme c-type cytochrome [Myxococcota bacterium]|nr:multiheme c-type cytochrome [Myxococcota bacterium]
MKLDPTSRPALLAGGLARVGLGLAAGLLLACPATLGGTAAGGTLGPPGAGAGVGPGTGPATDESRYAGVEVCRDCHPTAWRSWLGSRHARATVALHTPRGRDVAGLARRPPDSAFDDPACLRCHGVGVVDGRIAPGEPGFHPSEGVTCESCHGPRARHVTRRREQREPAAAGPAAGPPDAAPHPSAADPPPPPRACLDCHAPKASHPWDDRPSFDEVRAREQIRHGREPGPGPAPERAAAGGGR